MSENIDQDALSAAAEAAASDFVTETTPTYPSNAPGRFKPLGVWFTFEHRCLVCGRKYSEDTGLTTKSLRDHLDAHVSQGVLEIDDEQQFRHYRQVKAHPVGFPGILLPKELVWAK